MKTTENMIQAINLCQNTEKANSSINLTQKLVADVQSSSERSPIFSKEVNFYVLSREGYKRAFNKLLIKKLEIRPNLSRKQGEYFCFSLMLAFVTENDQFFLFRIARTNNWVQFYPVECEELDDFFISTKDAERNDVCIEFYSKEDFMETMNFSYDSIDAFNDRLESKLATHLSYFCKTPIERKLKEKEFFSDYLCAGMKIGIYGSNGTKVASAIISKIKDKSLDFYPGTRLIELNNFNNYFPKNTALTFIPNTAGFKEGWYVIVNNNCDINGPIYEIRPE